MSDSGEELPSAAVLLARLTWFDLADFRCEASAAEVTALTRGGLLVDAIRSAWGVAPRVVVTRETEVGPNVERDIRLVIGEDTLIEAHSLLPSKTIHALPFLGRLGTRALGLALREHGFDRRTEYEFARSTFPLLPTAGRAPVPTWARRFRIDLTPHDDVTIVEVFAPALMVALSAASFQAEGHFEP